MAGVFANGKFLSQKISGVQRYASQLLLHYYGLNKELKLIAPAERPAVSDFTTAIPVITRGAKGSIWWEQAQLPSFLSGQGKPLLLNLCNMAPVFYRNKITCIHDIAFLRYPQYFSKTFHAYYRAMIPAIIKTSKHIITVSEFSRSELMDYYKLSTERISVIPNAAFSSGSEIFPADTSKVPIVKPYFLFVGSADPRKNLLFLLKAFEAAQLKETDLVIAGGGYASFNNELMKKTDTYRRNPNIHFVGHITDSLLTQYYNNARAVIVPSVYEGFGLPVAEALSAHCEVLAADIPVFREVAAENAYYFDPYHPDALIALMRERDGTRKPDGIAGHAFIHRRYSWKKSANSLGECISKWV